MAELSPSTLKLDCIESYSLFPRDEKIENLK